MRATRMASKLVKSQGSKGKSKKSKKVSALGVFSTLLTVAVVVLCATLVVVTHLRLWEAM